MPICRYFLLVIDGNDNASLPRCVAICVDLLGFLPGLIGGRDRQAVGTWLAVNVRERRAAVVLNRIEPTVLESDARSRARRVLWWRYDGAVLTRRELEPGLHILLIASQASAPAIRVAEET